MIKELIIIFVAVVFIVFSPLLSIWALNVLFPVLAIPYTFETWVAAVILLLTIQAVKVEKKK